MNHRVHFSIFIILVRCLIINFVFILLYVIEILQKLLTIIHFVLLWNSSLFELWKIVQELWVILITISKTSEWIIQCPECLKLVPIFFSSRPETRSDLATGFLSCQTSWKHLHYSLLMHRLRELNHVKKF